MANLWIDHNQEITEIKRLLVAMLCVRIEVYHVNLQSNVQIFG
jgi:hypothetical protein